MATIYASSPAGPVAVQVDPDVAAVEAHRPWVINEHGYVIRRTSRRVKDCQWPFGVKVRLHRVVLPTQSGLDVHHIDGNPLNNRRSNLERRTPHENRQKDFTGGGLWLA